MQRRPRLVCAVALSETGRSGLTRLEKFVVRLGGGDVFLSRVCVGRILAERIVREVGE